MSAVKRWLHRTHWWTVRDPWADVNASIQDLWSDER